MKTVKYCFWDYLLFDFAGVERRLSEMAAQGWYLDKTGITMWKFRRGEPRSVTFAVTYVSDASEFNARPTGGQQELENYCEEMGWQKVTDWFQMQIFASEQQDPIPVETDERMRLENIHRSMKKNFLPSTVLLMVIGIFLLLMQGSNFFSPSSYATLSLKATYLFGFLDAILLLIMSGVNMACYYGWYKKSRDQVEQGGGCAMAPPYRMFNKIVLYALFLMMALWVAGMLADSDTGLAVFSVVYMLILTVLTFMAKQVQRWLKRFEFSKGVNIFLTLLVELVMAIVLISALMYVTFRTGLLF